MSEMGIDKYDVVHIVLNSYISKLTCDNYKNDVNFSVV
jgi:hypothetical protein